MARPMPLAAPVTIAVFRWVVIGGSSPGAFGMALPDDRRPIAVGLVLLYRIECYISGGRFFTVTGKVYQKQPRRFSYDGEEAKWVNARMIAFDEASTRQKHVLKEALFMANEDLTWDEWNTRGMALHNACWDGPAGRDAWFKFSRISPNYGERE